MDNASKALIIAGAILIAVMLVSLGVMLYNTAAGVAEGTISSMESLGVDGYNAQFSQSFGDRQSASVCQGLIDKVITNNQAGENTITITFKGKTKAVDKGGAVKDVTLSGTCTTNKQLSDMRAKISSRDTVYKIQVDTSKTGGGYDSSGAIKFIVIEGVEK